MENTEEEQARRENLASIWVLAELNPKDYLNLTPDDIATKLFLQGFNTAKAEDESLLAQRDVRIADLEKEYRDYKVYYDRIFEKSIVVEAGEYADMCDELSALREFVEWERVCSFLSPKLNDIRERKLAVLDSLRKADNKT